MKLNKKAGEKIFTLWWFVSIVLVGVVITTITINYFGAPIDTRDIELEIMNERLLDCLIKDSYLVELPGEEIDLLSFCGLNHKLITESEHYYIEINIFNERDEKTYSKNFGNIIYKKDCEIAIGTNAKYYPLCIKQNESVLVFDEKTDKKIFNKIELTIGTNNHGKKI